MMVKRKVNEKAMQATDIPEQNKQESNIDDRPSVIKEDTKDKKRRNEERNKTYMDEPSSDESLNQMVIVHAT